MKEIVFIIAVLGLTVFISFGILDADSVVKAYQLEEGRHTARANEQEKQCKAQGGQVQIVYNSDNLCWKDGKVMLVINGDSQ